MVHKLWQFFWMSEIPWKIRGASLDFWMGTILSILGIHHILYSVAYLVVASPVDTLVFMSLFLHAVGTIIIGLTIRDVFVLRYRKVPDPIRDYHFVLIVVSLIPFLIDRLIAP